MTFPHKNATFGARFTKENAIFIYNFAPSNLSHVIRNSFLSQLDPSFVARARELVTAHILSQRGQPAAWLSVGDVDAALLPHALPDFLHTLLSQSDHPRRHVGVYHAGDRCYVGNAVLWSAVVPYSPQIRKNCARFVDLCSWFNCVVLFVYFFSGR